MAKIKNKEELEYIKNALQYPIIGIDESYTRTGIAVTENGKLLYADSIDFKKMKTKTEKRNAVKKQ